MKCRSQAPSKCPETGVDLSLSFDKTLAIALGGPVVADILETCLQFDEAKRGDSLKMLAKLDAVIDATHFSAPDAQVGPYKFIKPKSWRNILGEIIHGWAVKTLPDKSGNKFVHFENIGASFYNEMCISVGLARLAVTSGASRERKEVVDAKEPPSSPPQAGGDSEEWDDALAQRVQVAKETSGIDDMEFWRLLVKQFRINGVANWPAVQVGLAVKIGVEQKHDPDRRQAKFISSIRDELQERQKDLELPSKPSQKKKGKKHTKSTDDGISDTMLKFVYSCITIYFDATRGAKGPQSSTRLT